MQYSKIKRIWIENFRCLQRVCIDFSDSPIITLSGGNDSGKSSTVKAIQTIMYNDNQRESMGFVKTGTKGFIICIEFEDGTCVFRERSTAGNIYRLQDASGKTVSEYTKLDKGNVPPEVQNIFGVFIDDATGELLNIRTCESLLLFALTKGSENYKIMHGSLKVEEVSNALLLAKERINQMTSARNNCEAAIMSYEAQVRKIIVPNLEPVEQLKGRIDATANVMKALQAVVDTKNSIANMLNEAGEVNAAIQSLSDIDIDKANITESLHNLINGISALNNLKSSLSSISSDECADSVDEMKLVQMQQLGDIRVLLEKLAEAKAQLNSVQTNELDDLRELTAANVNALAACLDRINGIGAAKIALEEATAELYKLQEEAKAALKNRNVYYDSEDSSIVAKCSDCGSEYRLALDDIEHACEEALTE